jgi:hypothetical protein
VAVNVAAISTQKEISFRFACMTKPHEKFFIKP